METFRKFCLTVKIATDKRPPKDIRIIMLTHLHDATHRYYLSMNLAHIFLPLFLLSCEAADQQGTFHFKGVVEANNSPHC